MAKQISKTDLERITANEVRKLFVRLHKKVGTVAGDITPEQVLRLDEIERQLINLIVEQVEQNRG